MTELKGNKKRTTLKEYKIEFTLKVQQLDTDWWEAYLRDHSGYYVVSWATTEQLVIEQVSALMSQEGAFDKIKIKNGCVGSLPGSASGAAVDDLQHASALHAEGN